MLFLAAMRAPGRVSPSTSPHRRLPRGTWSAPPRSMVLGSVSSHSEVASGPTQKTQKERAERLRSRGQRGVTVRV